MKQLYITVIEVSGLPDKSSFWMSTDPYVKIKVGDVEKETSVKNRAGSRAIFHESFVVPLASPDCMVEIFDKATLTSDNVLAAGTLTVNSRSGYSYLGPIPLEDKSNQGLTPEITLAISVHDY